MKKNVEATLIRVTPNAARSLLDTHEKLAKERGREALNRNISDNLVTKYANDMRADKWEVNGETVKVAMSGRLLDGQHRLWAAAFHEVSFWTMMVTGLDEESFYTIDIGRGRKPSDFLAVEGVPNSPVVAAASRLILGFRRRDLKANHMIPTHEVVAFAKANARAVESASRVKGCHPVAPLSVCAAWHFLFSESSQEGADKFIDDIRDGVGLNKGDPVLAIRERLIKNRASRAKLAPRDIFVIGIRAWNDRRSGKVRVRAAVSPKESGDALPKVS